MYPAGSGIGAHDPDHLTFDLADAAKLSLSFYGKRPGPGMRRDKLSMQFAMHDTEMVCEVLEAYERLILDVMRDDRTLFTTAEGIERLWEVSTPLLERGAIPTSRAPDPVVSASVLHLTSAVRAVTLFGYERGRMTCRSTPAPRSRPGVGLPASPVRSRDSP